jgi:hypothetical protein
MSHTTAAVLLWLFIIFLGIACGAGLYEHRIVLPQWLSTSAETGSHWNADAARQHDTGRRFWAFVTTGPLTLLTLANVWAAWQAPAPVRTWWLIAAVVALIERIFTFSYFIPTMVGLMNAADTPQAVATATRWSMLNYGRHVLVFIAWLSALKTFSLFYATRG